MHPNDLAILRTVLLIAGAAGLLTGYSLGKVASPRLGRLLVGTVIVIVGILILGVLWAFLTLAGEERLMLATILVIVGPVLFVAIAGPFLAAFALGRWIRRRLAD